MTSWCHHHNQDAQSGVMRTWGVQTSFFAIEYLLSRVVDVATLCFICSRSLGKCQSFLDKQKLLIVELIWMSSKTFSAPMRTPCPTLSDWRWTIKWPTMINDPDWSVEIWMLFLTARLITINNSYLARAAHCPDKSSQLMGSPIKCSSHWCRDCSEYAGSDLNTHHPNCLNTATDNVLCHS